MNKHSLEADERETIISWSDSDKSHFFIYSSQQPMIRKLLRNPKFILENERFNKEYSCYPRPICVEGYLPLRCLTIRTKFRKVSDKERKRLQEHMKKIRKVKNKKSDEV